MVTISEIAKWLMANDDIAIMSHVRPDGDSLGSTLALKLALEQLGKRAVVVYPDPAPAMYSYLPGLDTLVDENSLPFEPKAAIMVDIADTVRLGRAAQVYESVTEQAVVDHHEVTDCRFPRHYIRPQAAAASELIYELIGEMGVQLTADIATCLYTGMSTDTGNFSFSNTTPSTLRCCAECIAAGVNVSELTRHAFRLRSPQKLKLLGMGINGIEYYADGKLSLTRITLKMIDEAGAVHSDTDRIVNSLLDTNGVYVAIVAEEYENDTKFSFRSIGDTDVSVLAKKVGGGGHARASGATVKMPLNEAVEHVLSVFLPVVEAIAE